MGHFLKFALLFFLIFEPAFCLKNIYPRTAKKTFTSFRCTYSNVILNTFVCDYRVLRGKGNYKGYTLTPVPLRQ
jgi:hypothetical protein